MLQKTSRLRRALHLCGAAALALLLASCGGGGGGNSSGFVPLLPPLLPPAQTPSQATVAITDDAQGTAPPTRIDATYSARVTSVAEGFFTVGGTCTTPPTAHTLLDSTGMVATVRLTGGNCEAAQTLSLTLDPTKAVLDNATLAGATTWTRSYTIVPGPLKIGGAISGLVGTVVLQNNAGETLTASTDGTFAFPTAVAHGGAYAVTVATQPAGQTCTVSHGSGTVGTNPVNDVAVVCSANAYTVGGALSGLAGTVVLQNNGGDALTLNADGAFTFIVPVASGATYDVTVLTQPAAQTCTVSNGSGTMGAANVINVTVVCAVDSYTVGGIVSGLAGTVVLQNNGGDNAALNSDGAFTFATPVANGGAYNVTVLNQPAAQVCTVGNGSGTLAGADVANVTVSCAASATTLTLNAPSVVVPVNGPARTLIVTNTGTNPALNVTVTRPGGWSALSVDNSACAVVAPGGTCTLQFTSTAPYVASGAVSVQGDNTAPVSAVIGFSLDGYLVFDVPSAGTATVVDSADLSLLPGPYYLWGAPALVAGATSLTDGAANTQAMVSLFGPSQFSSVAGACRASGLAGLTWYVPAICQLSASGVCSGSTASIQKNVIDLGLGQFAGTDADRWSSTQSSPIEAWSHKRTDGSVVARPKLDALPVRCVASVSW